MNDSIIIGAMVASLYVLGEAIKAMTRQRASGAKNGSNSRLLEEVHDLWNWHNKENPETGVKLWYVQPTLEKAIERLADNLEAQTRLLQSIDRRIEGDRK